MAWSVLEIAQLLGAELMSSDTEAQIKHLQIDSRVHFPPSKTLFIAIRGEQHDGHDYISDLIQRGYRYFLVEEIRPDWKGSFIRVENAISALQKIAGERRRRSKAIVTGITGSNGKTIVKEWTRQLVFSHFKTVCSPRSYNSQVGVPISLWELKRDTERGIFEAGISKSGEMIHLEQMIKPEIGVFTTLGAAHDENFSSRSEKLSEKALLFQHSERVICNIDQREFQKEIAKINPRAKRITWSIGKGTQADVHFEFHPQNDFSEVIIRVGSETYATRFDFIEQIAFENLASSVCAALANGVSMDALIREIPNLHPVAMRMQRMRGIENSAIINDSYNSDTTSLRIALEHLHRDSRERERIVILSDILQSGKKPEELYGRVAEWLTRYDISRLYGIGPELSRFKSLFGHQARSYPDTNSFIKAIPGERWKDTVILIKGARKFEFEDVVEMLEEKEHDTVYEINLNAVQNNLNVFRKTLNPEVKLMAMVKAFAYGSGYSELARALQFHRVDYLGVAYSDEGIILRKSGIQLPIMVMNPESSGYPSLIRYSLEPQIYNFRVLHRFLEIARAEGVSDYPIHIKLETGMNRLGFQEDELEELIGVLQQQSTLRVHALFSHLAASDDPNEDDFSRMQKEKFERMASRISESLKIRPIRHLLNSNGIARFPEAQYEMVRLGIGLYGFSASQDIQNKLRCIGRLRTIISQVKLISPGDTVGYNRSFSAEKAMRIATVPVGYADGIPRVYGQGKIYFKSGEYQLPTVGNICMDMCMIDITDTNLKEGDEVVLFDEVEDIRRLAKVRGTITYEVLTSISERVKRVYIEE